LKFPVFNVFYIPVLFVSLRMFTTTRQSYIANVFRVSTIDTDCILGPRKLILITCWGLQLPNPLSRMLTPQLAIRTSAILHSCRVFALSM